MVNVVMNNGVLAAAMCNTAERACDPTFCIEIASFRDVVARVQTARSISTASTYCCHNVKPREHNSMARARYGDPSLWRYSPMDLDISVSTLENVRQLCQRSEWLAHTLWTIGYISLLPRNRTCAMPLRCGMTPCRALVAQMELLMKSQIRRGERQ